MDFWATESIIELAKREKREILILINRANAKSKLIQEAHKFVNKMNVKKAKTILGNRQIFVSTMGIRVNSSRKTKNWKRVFRNVGSSKRDTVILEILNFNKLYE